MLTTIQTTEALARLKPIHSMLALDEAVTIVTGQKPLRARRSRQRVADARFDNRDAVAARPRELEGGDDDGELTVTDSSRRLRWQSTLRGWLPRLKTRYILMKSATRSYDLTQTQREKAVRVSLLCEK